jgi:hypothetical protein
MRRLVMAVIAIVGSTLVLAPAVAADVNLSVVALSCSDNNSVIASVDLAALTSLAADVQSINAANQGLSCSLTTLDPSTETTKWTVYDYNPSGQALAPRNSPNSLPATTTGSTTTFQFKPDIYTALLTTTDKGLTGNLSGKVLTDFISLSGDAVSFMTQHGGGDCVNNVPAAVRFFFRSPSASGPSTGDPPAGFYTQYWWSNPVNLQMLAGNQSGTITANMSNPAEWSDWNGQPGTNPVVTASFIKATQNVQAIGLSFGGLCFFETGVTPSPNTFTSEQFSSTFTET